MSPERHSARTAWTCAPSPAFARALASSLRESATRASAPRRYEKTRIRDSMTTAASWLRCYRCWSQNLEAQVHYEGALKVDAQTGEARDPDEETIEAVVQCTDCLHDQPHLAFSLHEDAGRRVGRLEAIRHGSARRGRSSPRGARPGGGRHRHARAAPRPRRSSCRTARPRPPASCRGSPRRTRVIDRYGVRTAARAAAVLPRGGRCRAAVAPQVDSHGDETVATTQPAGARAEHAVRTEQEPDVLRRSRLIGRRGRAARADRLARGGRVAPRRPPRARPCAFRDGDVRRSPARIASGAGLGASIWPTG